MKLTKWIPIRITAAIVWTIFILTCAKVSAHDTVKIRDGKEVHDAKQEREMNAERGKDSHWHFGETQFGAWDRCIADTYDEENDVYRPEMCDEGPPPPPPPPEPPQNEGQSTPSRSTTRTRSTSSTTSTDSTSDSTAEVETYVTFPSPDKPPPAPEKPIAEIIEEVPEELEPELVHFDYPLWRGSYNLVSFPVVGEGIETVADFYDRYPFLNGDVVYVLLEGVWYPYNGDADQIAGQVPIVPYLGVVFNLNYAHYLGVNGIQLEGDGSIDLKPGLNILGLSELPSRYQRPSDLLVPGVEWVITRPSNSTPEGLSWYVISQGGDSGDEFPLAVGEAILIFCSVEVTLDMSDTVPAAPSAQQSKTLTVSWGAIKQ